MNSLLSRRFCQALLLGTISIALDGCVLPPKVEPQLEQLSADHLGLTGPSTPRADAAWWRAYGDDQFNTLVDTTLAKNTTLAQTQARVRAAQAQSQIARGGIGPDYSFSGSETRQRYSENYIIPPPFGGGTFWQGSVLANISWNIDLWGRQAALIRGADAASYAAQLDVAGSRLATTVALSQTYLDLNRAYALADIAQESVRQRQRIVDLVKKRIGAGLDTTVELREAEGAVPQAELSRAQAEAARDLAVHRLAALAGEGANIYTSLQRPTLNLETTLDVPTELPADLLGRRPDVLAARARVEAATASRAAAKAAFYPNVNLSAFAGFQAIGLDNLLESGSRTYGAGPAISLPLFKSSELKGEYRRATAEQDEAIAAYNDTVLRAVQQVADQLTLVQSSARQLTQARSSLTAAEEAYRLAQRRYEAGLANYLSVLTTETQVLNARTTYVDVLHAQALARVSLLLAVGGSFEPPAR
jgi:NodT family efflux transporter outer membrane factor (OMF) lipoprotein